MEKIPVIIPAYNEAATIGETLSRLDPNTSSPLVVVNNTTDNTAEIAASYGVDVIEIDEGGQVLALQAGVRKLGAEALSPMLFLDADSYPLFPTKWTHSMTRRFAGSTKPGLSPGLMASHDESSLDAIARTAYKSAQRVGAKVTGKLAGLGGANTALHLQNDEMLDAFLTMPNIWRGNDAALAKLVRDTGGEVSPVLDPRSIVSASARYCVPLKQRLRLSSKGYTALRDEQYAERAVPGTV